MYLPGSWFLALFFHVNWFRVVLFLPPNRFFPIRLPAQQICLVHLKKMSMKNPLAGKLLTLGAGLLVLGLMSCSKNDDTSQADVAGLMAFNLATDQPLVGVAISGNALPTPLPYTNYTGGYVRIYPGMRSISTFDAQTHNLIQADSGSFESGKYYSMFLIGAAGNYQNLVVIDALDSLSGTSGVSYIRYVNAVADSVVPTVTLATTDSTLMAAPASYREVSPFAKVPATEVTISLSLNNQIVHKRTITVEQQKVYTVLLLGNFNAAPAAPDSLQIRYVTNGTLTLDTTEVNAQKSD